MSAANQLAALIANMFATGLLDDQFQQLQMLQDPSAPNFVSEVVTLFCHDGERIIGELAKLLDKPTVDFDRVDAFVHQLKGSSASVGALKVKNTCIQFREFCQQKSKDGCLKTLETVRINFYELRGKFQTMLQIFQVGGDVRGGHPQLAMGPVGDAGASDPRLFPQEVIQSGGIDGAACWDDAYSTPLSEWRN
ncbi:unnamed protein product [Miscanthus lutarioriparius]|uniref:Histidine-containing phosphotransfer protein n=1 Tax=Miscanthus lutarioriparius TaxID=422564 RepID=A0A811R4U8_9POAL|nr:unnamed protein product [Miscanthus lutarioriparius]